MSDLQGILRTDVITSQYDVYWDDAAPLVPGRDSRPVLAIVSDYADGSAEQQQMQKMMDGSRLTPDQYHILKLRHDQHVAWYRLREALNPRIVFLVGVLPAQLGISAMFKVNEPNRFNDRIFLPTLPLKELDVHADMKKQLWLSGMKPLFVDKLYGEF